MERNYIKKSFALAGLVLGALGMNAQTTFNYTGSLQSYTVPAGVSSVMIDATGAKGGVGTATDVGVAGQGARMIGDFLVTPGQVLKVLVGEEGETADYVGGGGGGSFVWDSISTTLFIAAGGGGGGGKTDNSNMTIVDGIDAVTTNDGTNGNGVASGAGTAGNGGTQPASITEWASGGAGWNTDGADGSLHGCTTNSTGGQTPLAGGAGGIGGGNATSAADGGYGGGGGNNARCGAVGAGGGGGYSGGGPGGETISNDYAGGGGAGSFNSGSNQTNTAGVGNGNGIIIITAICSLDTSTTVSSNDITSNDATATYQWIDCGNGNALITGETSATYTAVANGDYAVIVTNGVCVDTSACVNISTVGLDNTALKVQNVQLYPNPTTDNVTISLGALKNAQISIVNVAGAEVYSLNNVTEKEVNVSLTDFSKGVYFVKVKSNTQQKVIKLIKE